MNDASARPLKIYLIAGEASGDLLGAHLMRALKAQSPQVQFYGIGGERMQAEGLTSLFDYQELSLFGFFEILPYVLNIFARVNAAVEDIGAKKPDMVITIDVPGFSLRVVERLRKLQFPAKFVHYVAPTVWAYKPQRAELCARLFDHMLVLLPFEPPYFEKVGLATTFVGHPVVAETSTGNGAAFREKYDIHPDRPLFCLLPGSRKGEIKRHMPIFGRAVTLFASRYPDLAMAVAVPPYLLEDITEYFAGCPFRAVITSNNEDKKNAVAACNLAIVKSGTVALEVAMAGVPMLVSYRVNPLSAWSFKRISLTKYVNLINIMAGREIVPELLQEQCNPLMIASCAQLLLADAAWQQRQREDIRATLAGMIPASQKTPSEIAAMTILRILS
jgi:lipid-A-disaccharide synthase